MKLTAYEAELLYDFLGRIDIIEIPAQHFPIFIALYERLGQVLMRAGKLKEPPQ